MDNDSNSSGKSKYVRLITNDDHEFVIERELAVFSSTIRAMIDGPPSGGEDDQEVPPVYFREIDSLTMQMVCRYLRYKKKYTNSVTEIREFPISPEMALPLLLAANFLDC